jgi:hypothetical protein
VAAHASSPDNVRLKTDGFLSISSTLQHHTDRGGSKFRSCNSRSSGVAGVQELQNGCPTSVRQSGFGSPVTPELLQLQLLNSCSTHMKCYEVFGKLSPELTNEIFAYLLEFEKPVYKAMVENIASRRKLRPIFIERKPRRERHLWLQQALSLKSADDLTMQLLQIWLLGAQREMICEFLDSLGIEHDGKGVVDNLPAAPSRERLNETISKLLEKRSPEAVALYLHAFQAMDETGWSILDEALATDPRISLPRKSDEPKHP